VRRVPDLLGYVSALCDGAERPGPRACSIVVRFRKPDEVHHERTGQADERDRKAEDGGGVRIARVCARTSRPARARTRRGAARR
jgi:hypothetical protein